MDLLLLWKYRTCVLRQEKLCVQNYEETGKIIVFVFYVLNSRRRK
jgi:hypothetical protein